MSELRGTHPRFDPFQHLDAADDPNLVQYLLNHPTNAIAQVDMPGIVAATYGGGKTAQRVAALRSHWIGSGLYHTFPIPYTFPSFFSAGEAGHVPTLDDHLIRLADATAQAVLLSFAYRPRLFEMLPTAAQRRVAHQLEQGLSARYYLAHLRERKAPSVLSELLDRSFVLPDPPSPDDVERFCDSLERALPERDARDPARPSADDWFECLLDVCGFRNLAILVDGVDAFVQTSADPHTAFEWVAPVLALAPSWANQRIFLKLFLPTELLPVIRARAPHLLDGFRIGQLEWTPDLIAEMLRRRVYVASEGQFGSLDAIAGPGLRDIETEIARNTPAVPREAVFFAHLLLRARRERLGDREGWLEPTDWEWAITNYQEHTLPQA